TDNDLHWSLVPVPAEQSSENAKHDKEPYDSSPPSSSPSLGLRMSSGSAAASTAATPAAGVSSGARGAPTPPTAASSSSSTSTPAGMARSLTCSECPMVSGETSTST